MESPPVFRFPPNKDSQPLHTLSPERVNGTRPLSSLSTTTSATRTTKTSDTESQFHQPHEITSTHSSPTRKVNLFADFHPTTPTSTRGFALPQSPSLPEIHALRGHTRTSSAVEGLVKRFEHLDVRDKDAESVERRRRHEAELGRAQIAREEAESDVKRLRQEMRSMRKDAEDGRDRERKVVRRLETVMVSWWADTNGWTLSGVLTGLLRMNMPMRRRPMHLSMPSTKRSYARRGKRPSSHPQPF